MPTHPLPADDQATSAPADNPTLEVLVVRLHVSLVEARAWVEHAVAPLRPLSAAAAEPGEKLLRQIDRDLAATRLDCAVDERAANQRLNDTLAALRSSIAVDDALVGGRS